MDGAQSSQGSNLGENETSAAGWCVEICEKRTVTEATAKTRNPLTYVTCWCVTIDGVHAGQRVDMLEDSSAIHEQP